MTKKKKKPLKVICEFLLGLIMLLILHAIVFGIAIFSIPLALGVLTLITLIGLMMVATLLSEIKQIVYTKEFLKMFPMQNN